jgi:hypothetical protein
VVCYRVNKKIKIITASRSTQFSKISYDCLDNRNKEENKQKFIILFNFITTWLWAQMQPDAAPDDRPG